jgi:hypothetical protein
MLMALAVQSISRTVSRAYESKKKENFSQDRHFFPALRPRTVGISIMTSPSRNTCQNRAIVARCPNLLPNRHATAK